MLGFNQDEYLTSAREIIAARKPVSYTHLDVYKRQPQCAASCRTSVTSSCSGLPFAT